MSLERSSSRDYWVDQEVSESFSDSDCNLDTQAQNLMKKGQDGSDLKPIET